MVIEDAVALLEPPDELDEPDEPDEPQAAMAATRHAAAPAAPNRDSRTGSSLSLPVTVNRSLSTMNDHTFVHLSIPGDKSQEDNESDTTNMAERPPRELRGWLRRWSGALWRGLSWRAGGRGRRRRAGGCRSCRCRSSGGSGCGGGGPERRRRRRGRRSAGGGGPAGGV